MRALLSMVAVTAACSFSPGVIPNADAPPDGPPPITVGFAKDVSQTDEAAGTASVRVVLSKPSDTNVSVAYAVTGGTAQRPDDFLLSDGTLTFAPDDVEETIDITIGPDGMAEPNETIELTLSNPNGAVLGLAVHTVTIDMNTLPRVSFVAPGTSALAENESPTIEVVLDKASQITTSVEVMVTGGTATSGADYTLATTQVTFNPGEVSKPVVLAIENDTLDEPDEDVTITLVEPTNLVLGQTQAHAHTINDEDPAPTVQFALTASSVSEAGTSTTVAVSLSTASGKSFTVPFSVGNGSTASAADYTIATASPLTFAPGTTTQNITINVAQDTLPEGDETIVLTLGTPSPAENATLGANLTHTVTITDDDATCLGSGALALCFAPPTAAANLNGPLDTDTSPLCSTTPPLAGWTGGPDACFIVGTSVTVTGATTVTGSRPLVLFASENISIVADLDAASHRGGTSGPGSNLGCAAYTDAPNDNTSGAGGGAGGTFRTAGGNGGNGNSVANSGGSALPTVAAPPTTLRGGCTGQPGGDGFAGAGSTGGIPGAGGGAVYLVAAKVIAVTSGITVNVSGGGADAVTTPDGGLYGGGGGGGSGGMLVLHAANVSVTGARFMANGGGGSSGADNNTPGADGSDPVTSAPTAGGTGGTNSNAGGNGGRGFGTTTTVGNGGNGGSNEAGGGGGGGGGYILSNLPLTGATVSAGDIDP